MHIKNTTQKSRITLTKSEQKKLRMLQKKGRHSARELMRGRVLQKSAAGIAQQQIADEEDINRSTVKDICERFDKGRLKRALYDAARSGQPQKLNEKAEAHLIALACSAAPNGYDHWTLALLQKQMIADKKVTNISTVAIWHKMNKHDIKPWLEKNVVHTKHHT